MSYLIQRTVGRNLTLTQINTPVLRVGRGTNQDLRSENPAVALEHAIIESDAAGYLITDKGSITGTYVNRKPVESARLAKGDVIEIGDLRIEVQLADPTKPLFLRILVARAVVAADEDDEPAVAAPAAAAGKKSLKTKKIDYVAKYRLARPYLTKLSVTAILLILTLGVIGELVRPERQPVFMPGGVSTAHARARDAAGRPIAERCEACHTPWKSVSASKCMDCHPQDVHARFEHNPPDCITCHAEHRGATKLAAIPDQRCVGCHADLTKHVRAPQAELASARFAERRYGFADIAKAPVFGDQHPQFAWPNDPNPLRFNHKLHLAPKGVFSGTGRREVLQCKTCHNPPEAMVRFRDHCQGCHRLTFDARFPSDEAPHGGDPGQVYGYVALIYSGNRDLIGKPPAEVRRILTARKGIDVDLRARASADQVLKGKCQKCHDIQRRGTQLAVIPPVLRTKWLTHARFTHARHTQTACENCHTAANGSAATSDVLLPRLQQCTDCHAPNAKGSQAASTCLTCHEYHLRTQRRVTASLVQAGVDGLGGGGRMFQSILLVVIVVLVLVVLIPVGIALFQRLRPERAPAAPPRAPAATPPPPRPIKPDGPTDKVVRRDEPPPDMTMKAAKAIVVPPPEIDATKQAPIPTGGDRTEEPMRGTEMVQWYGLLHCTSGPLEGQRFVIEEDGFYIGRDPALAKIVIPDNKVSKRHLRIVPRGGKVYAIDEGSTNGTYLAASPGQRITEVQLKRGDTLILGDNAATFVYQI